MPDPESSDRRVVLVVGAEPVSAATVAAALAALGAGDLAAGADGPWVSGLHREVLERCGVEVDDARPTAWFETGKACANGITRARLAQWLDGRFTHPAGERVGQPRPELVLADPALPWLLGLWRAAALRCDARVVHVVVLRPAAEVCPDAGAVAAWVSRLLHVERATRGTARAFLTHADVARDWTVPFVALGHDLGLRSVQEATANQIRRGHDAVAGAGAAAATAAGSAAATAADPAAAQAEVPPALRELAERTWAALGAVEGPDPVELDRLRAQYQQLYAAAESITGSSVRAAARPVPVGGAPVSGPQAVTGSPPGPTGASTASTAAATLADRARHRVRRVLAR